MAVDLLDTDTPPNPAQFIRIDLFPANAVLTLKAQPQGEDSEGEDAPEPVTQNFTTVRVILTDTEAYIYADTKEGPRAVLRADLTAFEGTNRDGYTATLDGGSIQFKRSNGCGCGSRLRGIRPFPSTPHAPLSIF